MCDNGNFLLWAHFQPAPSLFCTISKLTKCWLVFSWLLSCISESETSPSLIRSHSFSTQFSSTKAKSTGSLLSWTSACRSFKELPISHGKSVVSCNNGSAIIALRRSSDKKEPNVSIAVYFARRIGETTINSIFASGGKFSTSRKHCCLPCSVRRGSARFQHSGPRLW